MHTLLGSNFLQVLLLSAVTSHSVADAFAAKDACCTGSCQQQPHQAGGFVSVSVLMQCVGT